LEGITMRNLVAGLITATLLAACTSKAPEPQLTRRVRVDASNIVEAQAAGYRIVNKQGETLYCRKEYLTGSRLKTTTSCLTAAQWTELSQRSRDFINNDTGRPAQTHVPHP
jgi:hypothetical protein